MYDVYYIYIYIQTYTYLYIYIYKERERERDIIKFCVCELLKFGVFKIPDAARSHEG